MKIILFISVTGFYSIKLDEIAISQRVRWLPQTNEVIEFCYNHKYEYSFEFENYISVNQIVNQFHNNNIHKANDALVVTISPISPFDTVPRPLMDSRYAVINCTKSSQ